MEGFGGELKQGGIAQAEFFALAGRGGFDVKNAGEGGPRVAAAAGGGEDAGEVAFAAPGVFVRPRNGRGARLEVAVREQFGVMVEGDVIEKGGHFMSRSKSDRVRRLLHRWGWLGKLGARQAPH